MGKEPVLGLRSHKFLAAGTVAAGAAGCPAAAPRQLARSGLVTPARRLCVAGRRRFVARTTAGLGAKEVALICDARRRRGRRSPRAVRRDPRRAAGDRDHGRGGSGSRRAEPDLAVGAIAAFVSNFFLGQGVRTPWQMLAWGACGVVPARCAAAE